MPAAPRAPRAPRSAAALAAAAAAAAGLPRIAASAAAALVGAHAFQPREEALYELAKRDAGLLPLVRELERALGRRSRHFLRARLRRELPLLAQIEEELAAHFGAPAASAAGNAARAAAAAEAAQGELRRGAPALPPAAAAAVARSIAQAAAQRHGVRSEARALDAFARDLGAGAEVGRRNSAALARVFLDDAGVGAAAAASGGGARSGGGDSGAGGAACGGLAPALAAAPLRGYLLTGRVDGYDEARDCVVEVKTRSAAADWACAPPRGAPAHDVIQVRCYLEMARFRQEREREREREREAAALRGAAGGAGAAATGPAPASRARRRVAPPLVSAAPALVAAAAEAAEDPVAALRALARGDAGAGASMAQLVEQFAFAPAEAAEAGFSAPGVSGAPGAPGSPFAAPGEARRRVTLVLRDAGEWARIHRGLLAACDDLRRLRADAAFREAVVRAATLPVAAEGAGSGGRWGGGGGGRGGGGGGADFGLLSFGRGFGDADGEAEEGEGGGGAEDDGGDEGAFFRPR